MRCQDSSRYGTPHITTHAIGQHSRRSSRLCRLPCYNTDCTQKSRLLRACIRTGGLGGIERQKCQHVVDMYAPKQLVLHAQPQARATWSVRTGTIQIHTSGLLLFLAPSLPLPCPPVRSQLKAMVGELAGAVREPLVPLSGTT